MLIRKVVEKWRKQERKNACLESVPMFRNMTIMCKRNVSTIAVVGVLAMMATANAVLINVNIDTTARTQSTLDGPIFGNGGSDLGARWNQSLGTPVSGTSLLDSTGAATTVSFTSNASYVGIWGAPALKILTGGAFQWVPTAEYTLTISGLDSGEEYDVYLASFHPNENGNRVLISTSNTTSTVGTQIADSGGGGGNDSTWVRGENFVVFEDVEPDGSNRIIFTLDSDWTTDFTKRAYLSGFQIATAGTAPVLPGPAINPNPVDGTVGLGPNTDLSWAAGPGASSSNVYFGTNPSPGAGEFQDNRVETTFDPGTLAQNTYYWRIDSVNSDGTTTGEVWSFIVGPPGKALCPMPYDGMTAVAVNADFLAWAEGENAVSSDVYFGTDPTPDSSEFKGNQTATTYDLPALTADTTYYWRIDQVNAQGTTTSDVWSFTTPKNSANTVKVFILAGQSNMEGQGEINPIGTQGTLEYIYNNDPVTYGHLKDGGNWAVLNDVWIWYKRGGTTLVKGGLTAGYGVSSTTIGPELQFGHLMGDFYGEQVLLIKTAWGGKSLGVDFRPPTSGWGIIPPVTAGNDGFYYQEMLDFVVDAMANIGTYFPAYSGQGYEIAGFGWHQGWNDRVTSNLAAEYEENMANFITDVRASLGVPDMPFVIATTGMDGNPDYSEVELAQLAMGDYVKYPEFEGNVAVVDTQDFWRSVAESPADQGYHWNRNAETYYLIGEAMGEAMSDLIGESSGDVNLDGQVDLADFAWLAAYWLEIDCNAGNNFCSGADINQVGGVGLDDLLILGGDWLEGAPRLMAHWKLDESSGMVASDSVGGNDGTLNGDPTWWPGDGKIGGALEFDGAGDYVEVEGYKGISGSNPRTVTAWVKTESGLSIVRWGTLEINGGLWSNVINTAGNLRAAVIGGSVVGDTVINDDTWHHVAIVLPDKANVKVEDILLYVDGGQEDTTISLGSQTINTAVGMDVLISLDGSVGLLDDVRIYNYALSEEEIGELAGVL